MFYVVVDGEGTYQYGSDIFSGGVTRCENEEIRKAIEADDLDWVRATDRLPARFTEDDVKEAKKFKAPRTPNLAVQSPPVQQAPSAPPVGVADEAPTQVVKPATPPLGSAA